MAFSRGREIQEDAHVKARTEHLKDLEHRAQFIAALASPAYAYARNRNGSIWVYHYDRSSPTGVLGVCGFGNHDNWAQEQVDRAGRPFPLSPTEGLQSSGAILDTK